jgi:hypothetical protein
MCPGSLFSPSPTKKDGKKKFLKAPVSSPTDHPSKKKISFGKKILNSKKKKSCFEKNPSTESPVCGCTWGLRPRFLLFYIDAPYKKY